MAHQHAECEHCRHWHLPPVERADLERVTAVLDGIGTLLKGAREGQGLSIRAAAEQIGVSFSSVSRAETGAAIPDVTTAVKILRWIAEPATTTARALDQPGDQTKET